MIPKKIHWCWFGNGEIPEKHLKYMKTWTEHHPDYELMKWDESNFDIKSAPQYVRDAYECGAYAMVSDYVRAYAIYNEGGWYMDTDVEVFQPFFDRYSDHSFVSVVVDALDDSNEHSYREDYVNRIDENYKNKFEDGYVSGVAISMALIGGEKGAKYLKEVLDAYGKLDYFDRSVPGCLFGGPIGPQIYSKELEKYGFAYKPAKQELNDRILILGMEIMRDHEDDRTRDGITCACHHCTFSWFLPYLSKQSRNEV